MLKKVIKQNLSAFFVGILILYSIYFLILTWASGDWMHPIDQFQALWYWILPMGIGFGLQTALFWHIRTQSNIAHSKMKLAEGAGLGSSTVSMAACCAHHVVDLVPLLGISTLATVLTKYQSWFFLIGVIFNLIGIIIMYKIINPNFNLNKIKQKS